MSSDQYRREVIDPGDAVSRIGHQVCIGSYGNSHAIRILPQPPGKFRGLVGHPWSPSVLKYMMDGKVAPTTQNDGAGGKPGFFTLVGTEDVFSNLGWEVIAMCADDIACGGGLAVLMSSILDIKAITPENLHLCYALMAGFADALATSGIVLVTGETAVMKHSVTAFCDQNDPKQLVLNWGAECSGLMRTDRPPNGSTIRPGMAVVGLHEFGYRCNGGTALIRLLQQTWGPSINAIRNSAEAMTFVRQIVIPSSSYAKFLSHLVGWDASGVPGDPIVRIHGMAHITGGGIWGKFRELLPDGVGAILNHMPDPPEVLRRAQELSFRLGGDSIITDHQCYGTFHGGCGALIVVEPDDVHTFCQVAGQFGHRATLVGETTSSPDREVVIHSRFFKGFKLSSLQP